MAKTRYVHSERRDLIDKAREAMLSAVQVYNNPVSTFKTESFIVLSVIGWTYLLHAFYRSKKIDYRYFSDGGKRKKYVRNSDGTIKYWDLKECVSTPLPPAQSAAYAARGHLPPLRGEGRKSAADEAGGIVFSCGRFSAIGCGRTPHPHRAR